LGGNRNQIDTLTLPSKIRIFNNYIAIKTELLPMYRKYNAKIRQISG